MATVTADPRPARTRPDPTRRLWQVPVFLLGVAAFVSVWQGWLPIGPPDPSSVFRSDLAALKSAIDRPAPDLGELKSLVSRVAGESQRYPEFGTAADFTLGSGYLRLAELTADLAESRSYWMLARQHLESIHPGDVAEADRPRLEYRVAKAQAAELPAKLSTDEAERLRNILLFTPNGEPAGDAPRFVAELGLRLVPPDLKRARDSLTSYIAEAGLATPATSLARAKLRLSEVYLALGDHDQAKKWLGQIDREAPSEVVITSKAQLARIRMADQDYAGASSEWEQVRARSDLSSPLRAAAAYHLGVCLLFRKPADNEQAAKLFEEATRAAGPEGQAAALRLAHLRLDQGDAARHRESAALLAGAVKGITNPGDYNNPLVPISEVQATFEKAVKRLMDDGAFETAVAVAGSYGSVAIGGRERERRAETLAAWGASLPMGDREAAAKLAAAAEEYIALAEQRPAETDKAEQLRHAASLFRQAAMPDRAMATLQKVLALPSLPDEVRATVGLDLAESLLAANRPEEALKLFTEVMASSAPASTIARYRLAHLLLDTRDPKKVPLGISLLEQIAQAERVAPAEQAVHERALVELAHEQIRSGNFAEAESRLRTQIRLYPTGPEAGLGKLLLAVCLLQRADPRAKPAVPDPPRASEEALTVCRELIAEVDARKKAGQASERDPWLRAQASIRTLQAFWQLKKPYDLITAADPLRSEFAGTADELIVLSFMYHAYQQLDKPEGMLTIRDQMKSAFDRLKAKPNAFWAKTGEYSRGYWEKVWFSPEKK